MSVSHPLAADEFFENADRDSQKPARRDPASGQDGGAETATPSAAALSILPEQVLIAPERLDLGSRLEFRRSAYELLERTAQGTGKLVISCGGLQTIDSAGLNALILIQRKAAGRRVQVVLSNMDHELQSLLVLTKLNDLFKLTDGKSH